MWKRILTAAAACSADTALASNELSIENGAIGATIDLTTGCAVSAMWAVGDAAKTNLINTFDLGRYVQASFYSGPANYEGCVWSGQAWSWNPIAAGDTYGNKSPVLSSSSTNTSITCTIIPMQWACNNIPCECTVEITYALDGNAMRANVTLNNARSDNTDYGLFSQEIPAVYVNGFLDRLVGYTGEQPCGDPRDSASLTAWDAGWDDGAGWPWVPGHLQVTEPWLAFLQESNDFGVGVYTGAPEASSGGGSLFHFDAGFAGTKGVGGSNDSPTGYMAPIGTVDLPGDGQWSYGFSLVLGDVADIRAKVCEIWRAEVQQRLRQQQQQQQQNGTEAALSRKAFSFVNADGVTEHAVV